MLATELQKFTTSQIRISDIIFQEKHNPEDIASRGVLPNKIVDYTLWRQGQNPACLRENLQDTFNETFNTKEYFIDTDIPEVKTNVQDFFQMFIN